MTELAYLASVDAGYVRIFRARVTALPPGGVVLDRTFFYPGGGGQPPDRGRLRADGAEWEVADVGRVGSAVVHRLKRRGAGSSGPPVGAEVEGILDWPRRYRHMRLHTGQHFLSARVFARSGLRTAKATLAGFSALIELEGVLPPDVRSGLESDLASALERPAPVSVRFVARAEWDARPAAPRSGLVPLAPQVDPVRVVEIEAEDACPCGGTHLRSTGEIGVVRLSEPEPTESGGSRLRFTQAEPDAPAPPE